LKKFGIIGIGKLKKILLKIRISFILYNIILLIIVIGLAGNKSDLFNNEKVTEEEALELSEKIGATTFRLTSAIEGNGINEIFKNIGLKLLDPDFKDKYNDDDNNDNIPKIGTIKLDINQAKESNKGYCCSYF
jgi:GTPase SAR1 family protein